MGSSGNGLNAVTLESNQCPTLMVGTNTHVKNVNNHANANKQQHKNYYKNYENILRTNEKRKARPH